MSDPEQNQGFFQQIVDSMLGRNKPPATTGSKVLDQAKLPDNGNFKRSNSFPQGQSPIKGQKKDSRKELPYEPVSITFLSGRYAGETLDMGLAVNETTHSQSAEWSEQKSQHIRPGLTFEKISTRSISLSLSFFDHHHDAAHLAENCYTLQEIDETTGQPPFLLLAQGSINASLVVCTDAKVKYSEPLPQSKGFRRAESVDLEFKLIGGLSSEHALGKPLTSTPLTQERAKRTLDEQQKRGIKAKLDKSLAPCLKTEKDKQQIQELVDNYKLDNVDAILKLSSAAFVQAAVGGMFAPSVYQDSKIIEKLKQDLAIEMALNEDGVQAVDGRSPRTFARAIYTGNIGLIQNKALRQSAEVARVDYLKIVTAIKNQDLGDDSSIFAEGGSTANRLRRTGRCGLQLRKAGSAKLPVPTADDKKKLAEINKVLGEIKKKTFGPSEDDKKKLKDMFGVETKSQRDTLLNGAPYTSKDQFVNFAGRNVGTLNGYKLWSNAIEHLAPQTPPP